MIRALALALLGLGVVIGATAAREYPVPSRPLAERLERWRHQLEIAERDLARGKLHEAAAAFSVVVSEAEAAGDRGLLAARALDGLGDVRRQQGRFEECVALYSRAAPLWESLLGPRQPRLATTLHNLAVAQIALGDREAARQALERALAILEATMGPTAARTQLTRRTLADLAAEPDGSR